MNATFQSAPNFSEGRNPATLAALQAAASAPGVALADFSADPDHNRCVATLVGDGEGIYQAALLMSAVAVQRIDLRAHAGVHPFVGALDVLPVIPLQGATMDEADALAKRIGRGIAQRLDVPVFFYALSASSPDRTALPALRKGGLPGLTARIGQFPPDEGPAAPHPTAGVAIVGARAPLIAYNVNLATDDVRVARRIAARLRESGGGLPGVRALGLALKTHGCAQVSVNITDTEAVCMADVYEAVTTMAEAEGVSLDGAELIGGISLENLQRNAGRDFGCQVPPERVLETWIPRG